MPAILGINFFEGTVEEAIKQMADRGGFLVAPSGTCFARLRRDREYRVAMTDADCAIADSGLMVILWRALRGGRVTRISGLRYLKCLSETLMRGELLKNTWWIVPNESAGAKLTAWLHRRYGTHALTYVAPRYEAGKVTDEELLALVHQMRPAHVVVGIGAGPQEKLGYYLRERLDYCPAIHCIGGALGVLTGDQKPIPDWADRLYLGWLFRLIGAPRVFLPRLWKARELPGLIARYGSELPPLRNY